MSTLYAAAADTFGLLGLGDAVYKTLLAFNAAQDAYITNHDPVAAYAAYDMCLQEIGSYNAQILTTIPQIQNRSDAIVDVEADYCNVLSEHLFALQTTVLAALSYVNVYESSRRRFFLKRIKLRLSAALELQNSEKMRMRIAEDLMMAYSLYNVALNADYTSE